MPFSLCRMISRSLGQAARQPRGHADAEVDVAAVGQVVGDALRKLLARQRCVCAHEPTPLHLHHAFDEDARRHHVVGRDRAERHDAVDLHDCRARGHAHHRAEVASSITIGQVAPAVGLERLDERIVARQRLLEHVTGAVDDACLLAVGQLAAIAHRREERPEAGRRGAHALDHDALRHALQFDLAGAVHLGERGRTRLRRVGRARERADQLAHAAGQEQLRQPGRPVAAVVVDHREVARALVEQRAQQLGGNARGAEAAHQQRGAIGHVFHGVGQRGHGLVEHGAILIGRQRLTLAGASRYWPAGGGFA